jgi:hypothetical protein
MDWKGVVDRNQKEFEKIESKKEEEKEEIFEFDANIKNYEEEFDYVHLIDIVEIKKEFKDYIDSLALPFLDRDIILGYNLQNDLYDYIKYNCQNLEKIKDKIQKENEEYIKELEEDDDFDSDYYDR